MEEDKEGSEDTEVSGTPQEHNPQKQLTGTHGARRYPRVLCINVMVEYPGVLIRFLTMRTWAASDSCLLVAPFSSYWVPLSHLEVMVCV